jgi:hypothetical protein
VDKPPSFIEELELRGGVVDPRMLGANEARIANLSWRRRLGETESAFLARARAAASLAGYDFVAFSGFVAVCPVQQFSPLHVGARKQ